MLEKSIYKEVPEVVHTAIEQTLASLEEGQYTAARERTERRRRRYRRRLPGAAVATIACVLIAGATVSAMGVVHLYRERMEAMDEAEIESFYTLAEAAEADGMNRPYTDGERARYDALKNEYETEGVFPQSQLTYLEDGDVYDGEGVAMDQTSRTLYLPDRELTDEELLEIIDMQKKTAYSIYVLNRERIIQGGNWESRMELLTDAEVDKVYLEVFGCKSDLSCIYGRKLTVEENDRYEELLADYENEGVYTENQIEIIESHEEYTGESIAFCTADSTFDFPEREMSDDELLQLIEYEHKSTYCISRIGMEVMLGIREGYPGAMEIEVEVSPEDLLSEEEVLLWEKCQTMGEEGEVLWEEYMMQKEMQEETFLD